MIYLLYGEENYLLSKSLKALEIKTLKDGVVDFNRDAFSAKTVTGAQILQASQTLPMMATQRLVLVTEAEALKKSDQELLQDNLEKIPETTALIFVATKIDRRQGFWKKLEKLGKSKEFKALYPREIPPWLVGQAQAMHLKLGPDVAQILPELVGTNLRDLVHALEKLQLYAHPRQTVMMEDVEASVSDIAARSVFDLADAMGKQNWGRSLSLLEKILGPSEPALKILGLIVRHFRILLKAKEVERQRLGSGEWARVLGVSPYFVDRYRTQAERLSRQQIVKTLDVIYHTDRALKSSPVAPTLVMENMVFQLAAD
jgi:DNA polymerase III subunit delta